METAEVYEALEAQAEKIANEMGVVFERYVKKKQKQYGGITMPALLGVCARLVVGAVRTFPEQEQQPVLKEFAVVLAHRYRVSCATDEKSPIIVRH